MIFYTSLVTYFLGKYSVLVSLLRSTMRACFHAESFDFWNGLLKLQDTKFILV